MVLDTCCSTREETGKIAFEEKVKVPKATWMSDGSHWPGTWLSGEPNHSRGNHASIIQLSLDLMEDWLLEDLEFFVNSLRT